MYNQAKNKFEYKWVYTIVGIRGLIVAFFDLREVKDRAKQIAETMNDSHFFGEDISITNFIGSGLYIVMLGAFGLLLTGHKRFRPKKN